MLFNNNLSSFNFQTLSYYGFFIFKYWVPYDYKNVTRRRRKKISTPKKSLYFAFNTRRRRKLIQSYQVLNVSNSWHGVIFKTLFSIFDGYKTYRNVEPYFVIRKFLRILCSHRRHFIEYVKYYNALVDKKFLKGRDFAKNIRTVTRFNFSFFKVHHYFFCCTSYLKLVRFFNRFFFHKNFFLLRFVFKHFLTKKFYEKKNSFFYTNNDFNIYKLNRYKVRKQAIPLLIDNLRIYNYNNNSRTFFSLGFNNIFYYFYSKFNTNFDLDENLDDVITILKNVKKRSINFNLMRIKTSLSKFFNFLLVKQRWFYMPALLRRFKKSFLYYLFREFRFVNFLIGFLFFNFSFGSEALNIYYNSYLQNLKSYKFFLSIYLSFYNKYLNGSFTDISHLSIYINRYFFSQYVILVSEYSVSTFYRLLRDIYSINSSLFLINFSSVVFDDYILRKKYLSMYFRMLNIRKDYFRYLLHYRKGIRGKHFNSSRLLTNFLFKQKRRIRYRNYPRRKRSKILSLFYKTNNTRFFKEFVIERLNSCFKLPFLYQKQGLFSKFRFFSTFFFNFSKDSIVNYSKQSLNTVSKSLFSYFKFNFVLKKNILNKSKSKVYNKVLTTNRVLFEPIRRLSIDNLYRFGSTIGSINIRFPSKKFVFFQAAAFFNYLLKNKELSRRNPFMSRFTFKSFKPKRKQFLILNRKKRYYYNNNYMPIRKRRHSYWLRGSLLLFIYFKLKIKKLLPRSYPSILKSRFRFFSKRAYSRIFKIRSRFSSNGSFVDAFVLKKEFKNLLFFFSMFIRNFNFFLSNNSNLFDFFRSLKLFRYFVLHFVLFFNLFFSIFTNKSKIVFVQGQGISLYRLSLFLNNVSLSFFKLLYLSGIYINYIFKFFSGYLFYLFNFIEFKFLFYRNKFDPSRVRGYWLKKNKRYRLKVRAFFYYKKVLDFLNLRRIFIYLKRGCLYKVSLYYFYKKMFLNFINLNLVSRLKISTNQLHFLFLFKEKRYKIFYALHNFFRKKYYLRKLNFQYIFLNQKNNYVTNRKNKIIGNAIC